MIKYPQWIYQQSAVLPYRWHGGDIEVLLITSRGGRRWVLPKGIVDPGLSAQVSAAKEAREEAGIEGAVRDRSLGSYTQDKWGGTCRIEVFPMRVTTEFKHWPEGGIRRRKWLSLKAAHKHIEDKTLRSILEELPQQLGAQDEDKAVAVATEIKAPKLLYLLRHAKSSWDDPTLADFDRPLADRGRAACEAMSEYLRMADVAPELVLCSPAKRTRQTLAGVQAVLGEQASTRFEEQIYEASLRTLLEQLRGVADSTSSVMLIGHNPGMQMLALEIADQGNADARERMAAKFPTAALAIFAMKKDGWKDLTPGDCRLHSFVVPRELQVAERTA